MQNLNGDGRAGEQMKDLKEGLINLKNISWLRMEYIIILAFGIMYHSNNERIATISDEAQLYRLGMGDPWLPPLIFYMVMRFHSTNKQVFENRNSRKAFLLLFFVVELILILSIILKPEFRSAAGWG